jgi:hydroxymethylbilane synthase
MTLRVATRGSRLARAQAARVIELLGEPADLVIVTSTGDRRTDEPIHRIGGTGVFVKEIEEAVLDGQADLAVHSAKDLPSTTAPGLALAAVPERADPRDAMVGAALDAVPTGGRIGTGSVRRRAQLAAARPDLAFGELRGNIETRIAKAADFDAVVIAVCALDRLGLRAEAAEALPPDVLLPQVAQGALAVECRADDETVREQLARIDDPIARAEVTAERAYLATLGGGCALPCGALARADSGGEVAIEALLASGDGRMVLRSHAGGTDPEAVGREAARRILDDHGGRTLLEDVA